MALRISLTDYNADWAYIKRFQHPKSVPGYLTPEEFVAFCGGMGVDAFEFTDFYWADVSTAYLKQLASDAGLPQRRHGRQQKGTLR